MLDVDEMAAYHAWKAHKLTSHPDLSVEAYNVEQEAAALAYEAGVKAAVPASDQQKRDSLLANSPYRRPGMLGHHKKITGE